MDTICRERYLNLIETHTPALRRLCHSYFESRTASEDLFQEIALAIWTALPRFRGECSDRTWLYRIAHNVALTIAAKSRISLSAVPTRSPASLRRKSRTCSTAWSKSFRSRTGG